MFHKKIKIIIPNYFHINKWANAIKCSKIMIKQYYAQKSNYNSHGLLKVSKEK